MHLAGTIPVFDLQFQFNRPLLPGQGPNSRASAPDAMTRPGPQMTAAPNSQATFMAAEDTIERLVSRLKGQTIPIRAPHDLADAIQRMNQRIARTAAPAAVSAKVEPRAQTDAPAPKADAQPAVSPSVSRPAREADSSGNEDPVLILMRLRDQVVEHGERIPNHTCVESIQRDRYEPVTGRAPKSCDTLLARRKQGDFQARLKLDSTDWLRLDVAYASGNEIYSWARFASAAATGRRLRRGSDAAGAHDRLLEGPQQLGCRLRYAGRCLQIAQRVSRQAGHQADRRGHDHRSE